MPKLFALTQIIMPPDKDGNEAVVERRSVFDATVAQAKQFDALKAARPATKEEIDAAAEAQAKADGTAAFVNFDAPATTDTKATKS